MRAISASVSAARLCRQGHLQQPEDLTALGHRGEHDPVPLAHTAGVGLSGRNELEPLGAQRHLDRTAVEGEHAGGLVVLAPVIRAPGRLVVRAGGVREPDQGPAGQVRDEEGDRAGAERDPQLAGDRFDGIHRRGGLRLVEHPADRLPASARFTHPRSIGAGRRRPRRECLATVSSRRSPRAPASACRALGHDQQVSGGALPAGLAGAEPDPCRSARARSPRPGSRAPRAAGRRPARSRSGAARARARRTPCGRSGRWTPPSRSPAASRARAVNDNLFMPSPSHTAPAGSPADPGRSSPGARGGLARLSGT